MRMRRMGSVFLLCAVATALAAEQDPSHETAIRATLAGYVDARNARDAAAVAEFFAEDYDQGNLSMGRLQIHSGKERADAYAEAFREGRILTRMESDVKNFRPLADDVALLDTELAFVNEQGGHEFHNFATFVFVKREGKWLIGAVRLSPISETAPARDAAPAWPAAREKQVRVTGWVSDESCGAEHRNPGGEDCVRKCIKGAPHLNPEWTAQRMVFVTDDDAPQVWVVTNPESLSGYEGKHMRVEGKLENEGHLTVMRAQPVDE